MPDPDTSTPSESEEPATPVPPSPVALRVANGPLAAPVLSRVVQMILARAACPLDRFDDALILCDAISAHAPAYSRDGHISFTLTSDARTIELRVAELGAGGASGLLEDAQLPDVGNVIERFSDARRIELAEDGSGEALVLRLDFG
jgi:serine/threonine-protein kinase RsbW